MKMLGLLILITIFFLLFRIEVVTKDTQNKPSCPPHKWVYANEDEFEEYMVCAKCRSLPGGGKEEG